MLCANNQPTMTDTNEMAVEPVKRPNQSSIGGNAQIVGSFNPFKPECQARRHLIEQLMGLTGPDALNVFQHRRHLETLTLAELHKLNEQVLEDLDVKFAV